MTSSIRTKLTGLSSVSKTKWWRPLEAAWVSMHTHLCRLRRVHICTDVYIVRTPKLMKCGKVPNFDTEVRRWKWACALQCQEDASPEECVSLQEALLKGKFQWPITRKVLRGWAGGRGWRAFVSSRTACMVSSKTARTKYRNPVWKEEKKKCSASSAVRAVCSELGL